MKLITAIVRTTSLQHVVQQLEIIGLRGLTITEVKGIGEEVRLNNPYSIHDKIEILVPDDKTEEAVKIILKHAATGLAGDGFVSVSSVDYAFQIRNRERLT
jgi:nitrogen regulatory protein P-II 1